jgi:hypothetical protein
MRFGLVVWIIVFISGSSYAQGIIPEPVSMKTKPGTFIISKKTVLAARDEEDRKTARLFNE